MNKINLKEILEKRMNELAKEHSLSEGDNGNAVISFEAGYSAAINDIEPKVQKLIEALESIVTEYAEDEFDVYYIPHTNPAFRIANQALVEFYKETE